MLYTELYSISEHVKEADSVDPPLNPFAIHVPANMIQKLKRDIVHNFQEHKAAMQSSKENDIGGMPTNLLSSGDEHDSSSGSEDDDDETSAAPNIPMSPSDVNLPVQKKSSKSIQNDIPDKILSRIAIKKYPSLPDLLDIFKEGDL